ncbi:MAG: oxidoreductase [Actinomycetia bacterium]|nr:oxidoreductase [Actinomycetes bacterium]
MFRAMLLTKDDEGLSSELTDLDDEQLPEGDVTVAVEYSTINYKDGLALGGNPGVVRDYPMVPGIDFAGVVESSGSPEWHVGDRVVLNGWRVGESHWGGLAEKARVKAEWLVPLPDAFTTQQAMTIGTAGYTAMLAVLALEDNGHAPDAGATVVTGSAGGVGSVSIALLSALGHNVIASTGRPQESDYLTALGASEIIARSELEGAARPLGKPRWAAGIDSVGSETLANVLSCTDYGGVVAACGLAGGMDLPTSVAPFILRGVTLVGIESVEAPRDRRIRAWNRLASDLDVAKLESMQEVVGLSEVQRVGADILAGKVRGRVVVDISA